MTMETYLEEIRGNMDDLFNHLHENPEISWKETQTTEHLANLVENLGLRVTRFADCTGFIAEWGPLGGPVVALRTDIDALWQEVDGVWRGNHSCGHDAHMTVITGAVHLLKQAMPNPPVRIRAIYQPAEETGEGAMKMVEKGAIDDVVYLFGIHLRPIQELHTGQFSACIKNGGAIQIDGRIEGVAAHGARPHLGVNAIEAAIAGWQAVQTIHLNPMVPYSVKITRIAGGGQSTNIIPDTAEFSYDLRAQTNEALDELIESVESRIRASVEAMGASVTLKRGARVMAAVVSEDAQKLLAESITKCTGESSLVMEIVSPGAEDFHYYTSLRPEVRATMLGLGCNLAPGLHHPKMTFDKSTIFDGMHILSDVVIKASQSIINMR